jgi:hypothetical protein
MTAPDQHRYESVDAAANVSTGAEKAQTLGDTALTGLAEITGTVPAGAESLLSPEQRTYAKAAVTSMSEQLGLDRGDIRFVLEETPDQVQRVVAIDASPNGQHIGLYQHIREQRQADPNWYSLEIAGERVDPLAGCTEAAYRAMIADARARGVKFLPDSLALNQHNGHVWTATMLTGEPLPAKDKVWIGSSSGGLKVNFVEHPVNRGGKSFRVRPAVVVGTIET